MTLYLQIPNVFHYRVPLHKGIEITTGKINIYW